MLLISREPSLTLAEIKSRLYGAADYWGTPDTFGAGKLNAYATLLPPPMAATITGPRTIPEYTPSTWNAVMAYGVPPYSYEWTVDAVYAGGASSLTAGDTWAGGYAYTIGLRVTDARARVATSWFSVYATPAGCPTCLSPPLAASAVLVRSGKVISP
jgi:hypothetical protein